MLVFLPAFPHPIPIPITKFWSPDKGWWVPNLLPAVVLSQWCWQPEEKKYPFSAPTDTWVRPFPSNIRKASLAKADMKPNSALHRPAAFEGLCGCESAWLPVKCFSAQAGFSTKPLHLLSILQYSQKRGTRRGRRWILPTAVSAHLELDSIFNTLSYQASAWQKVRFWWSTEYHPNPGPGTRVAVIVSFLGSRGGTAHSMGVLHLLAQGITRSHGFISAFVVPNMQYFCAALRFVLGPGQARICPVPAPLARMTLQRFLSSVRLSRGPEDLREG